jgi:hypothetical protein
MPQLYMLTVPGLEVASDWRAVHDRLLDDFAQIEDVLATTMAETLLIAYHGVPDVDGWLEGVTEAVFSRRLRAGWHARAGHQPAQTRTGPRVVPIRPFALPTPEHEKDLA